MIFRTAIGNRKIALSGRDNDDQRRQHANEKYFAGVKSVRTYDKKDSTRLVKDEARNEKRIELF